MNKKEYITPRLKVVNMETIYMLAATNRERYVTANRSLSRESNGGWDDDEDETEDSMWK